MRLIELFEESLDLKKENLAILFLNKESEISITYKLMKKYYKELAQEISFLHDGICGLISSICIETITIFLSLLSINSTMFYMDQTILESYERLKKIINQLNIRHIILENQSLAIRLEHILNTSLKCIFLSNGFILCIFSNNSDQIKCSIKNTNNVTAVTSGIKRRNADNLIMDTSSDQCQRNKSYRIDYSHCNHSKNAIKMDEYIKTTKSEENIEIEMNRRNDVLDNKIFLKFESINSNLEITPIETCILRDSYMETKLEMKINESAYIVTTSGTTGAPKIVHVNHSCIIPNIYDFKEKFNITSSDCVMMCSPLTFDPSYVEMFSAFLVGATLIIASDENKMNKTHLANVLKKVTFIQMTPTLLNSLGEENIKNILLAENSRLKCLVLGGESFPSLKMIRDLKHPNNLTKLFNIYGTTELSSWACLYEILPLDIQHGLDEVPIGNPLSETLIDLRPSMDSDLFEIWIGSATRISSVNDEVQHTFESPLMRFSGDIGKKVDGNVIIIGRYDDMIKRHGKRVHLNEIEKMLSTCYFIKYSTAILHNRKIILFAKIVEYLVGKPFNAKLMIRRFLKVNLPSYYIPDDIVLVDEFPHTRHGKLDKCAMMIRYTQTPSNLSSNVSNIEEIVNNEWREVLLLNIKESYSGIDFLCSDNEILKEGESIIDDGWIKLGGDSLKAITFNEKMETIFNIKFVGLVDLLLSDSNLVCIKEYVLKTFMENSSNLVYHEEYSENKSDKISENNRNCEDAKLLNNPKNYMNICCHGKDEILRTMVLENQLSEKFLAKKFTFTDQNLFKPFYSIFDCKREDKFVGISKGSCYVSNCELYLLRYLDQSMEDISGRVLFSLSWTFNMGKCVDASPLVLIDNKDRGSVFIGSHSHRFASIDLISGKVNWEVLLAERIESTACISFCANYIITACYGGKVYVLDVKSGQKHWVFKTSKSIKSSPIVNQLDGSVYIGSYDGCCYALDIYNKKLIWKQDLQNGSIFASIKIVYTLNQLVICTLGGTVFTLNLSNGEIICKLNIEKPIFATPAVSNGDAIYVASVDGLLRCIDAKTSVVKWTFSARGSIFSSPVIFNLSRDYLKNADCESRERASFDKLGNNDPRSIINSVFDDSGIPSQSSLVDDESKTRVAICFASHDKYIYCVDAETGSFNWSTQLDSEIYSTPFVPGGGRAIFASTTAGSIYRLNAGSGKMVGSYKLQGKIFSSPCVARDCLIVGCRDDNVYAINISDR